MRLSFVSVLSFVVLGCAVQPTEDVESLVDEICCGASCCLIGGDCYTSGETNPANTCEACNPSTSQTEFTASADGCDGGAAPMPDAGGPMDAAPEGDAGEDDAGAPMMDSGPMDDAGGDDDAGSDPDTGTSADAGGGTDAGDGGGGGGGCSVASGSQNVWLLAIGIVALIWRRRRLS